MKEKIIKFRKAGWIITGILTVLMIGLLVAYIATGGTYGLETETTTALETTAALIQ